MNIPDFKPYATPLGLATGTILAILVVWSVSSAQNSCGRKHETGAAVAGAIADTHAKELAELKQQLAGKETEIASVKSQALTFKQKYEAAKAKIPSVPPPPPVGQTELAQGLEKLGLGDGLEVQVGANSLLSVTDAQVIWNLGEDSKRAKALDEALITCAQAVTASEAVVKAQGEGLDLSAKALHQSQEEAAARASQVQELGKALKVEKAKGWKVYVYPAAAVALTFLVKK